MASAQLPSYTTKTYNIQLYLYVIGIHYYFTNLQWVKNNNKTNVGHILIGIDYYYYKIIFYFF